MRIFIIGCLTLIGLVLCFTQLTIFNGGVSVQEIDAPTLPTFIWNLATLMTGIFLGSMLMQNLVEGYYKYYDLLKNFHLIQPLLLVSLLLKASFLDLCLRP